MESERILKFGDVFRFKEQEFVFFYLTTDFMYVARILDLKQSQQVKSLYENKVRLGHMTNAARDHAIYSFVVLTTEEFNERMANFAKTQEDVNIFPDIVGRVNDDDLKAIKKEIISDSCPVARVLKDYVKSL
jgi:hypothetical protein